MASSFVLPPVIGSASLSCGRASLRNPQGALAAGKGFGKPSETSNGSSKSSPAPILTVPFEYVKIGPLKMFLSLWVMGQEDWSGNEIAAGQIAAVHDATQGSLLISLSEGADAGLEVSRSRDGPLQYRLQEALLMHRLLDDEIAAGQIAAVHDATQGSLLISLSEGADAGLEVSRSRDGPLQYRLQEALLMHRLLDELEDIMGDSSIADDTRVFKLAQQAPSTRFEARSQLGLRDPVGIKVDLWILSVAEHCCVLSCSGLGVEPRNERTWDQG
eukprot:CAMPEP_0202854546 /NCGR_PEP_ID=MMETSP1389-20130828/91058_1 /ASSEMBLY_ACC=CAM_ASM_000865 /TAXON_ID=302021 /ORGANISM="Rhodomonas sp., Strain CCMP768" /LENGTH=272 /DNA_ID=CAMNT_0049533141 /DNA_START=54 /DNA_END=873 /DNA_ORIENTATION=+